MSENFGIGRSRDRRSSSGSPPIHDGVKVGSEFLVVLLRAVAPSFDHSTGTVDSSVEHVTSEFAGHGSSVVGLGDEESVPNPFAEFETDSIEEMVRDPMYRRRGSSQSMLRERKGEKMNKGNEPSN